MINTHKNQSKDKFCDQAIKFFTGHLVPSIYGLVRSLMEALKGVVLQFI